MTRDSTQLIAAVTVVVAILASITVVTEILTPEGNDTVQGDWYLTEMYSVEDGRRVIEHIIPETRSGEHTLTISVENGNMITGVFHDGHVTGTVEGDTINCSFTRDGSEFPCQGIIQDDMILVSTLCSSTVDGRTIIYAVDATFCRGETVIMETGTIPVSLLIDSASPYSDDDPPTPILDILDTGGRLMTATDSFGTDYVLLMDDRRTLSGGHGIMSMDGSVSEMEFTVSDGVISITQL